MISVVGPPLQKEREGDCAVGGSLAEILQTCVELLGGQVVAQCHQQQVEVVLAQLTTAV